MMEKISENGTSRIPNIYVAGFQKCATTTLFSVLRSHPEIGSIPEGGKQDSWPFAKEPGFFSINYEKGLEWYADFFCDCTEPNLIEATPIYAANPIWIQRMATVVPDAKIILSVRDPVKRAYSAWNHWKQLPEEARWQGILDPKGTFSSNILAELEAKNIAGQYFRLVGTGYYYEQLEQLLELFPAGRIHITSTEWLEKDYDRELIEIQKFLGITEVPLAKKLSHQRAYSVAPMERDIELILREQFRSHDARLRDYLKRDLPWD